MYRSLAPLFWSLLYKKKTVPESKWGESPQVLSMLSINWTPREKVNFRQRGDPKANWRNNAKGETIQRKVRVRTSTWRNFLKFLQIEDSKKKKSLKAGQNRTNRTTGQASGFVLSPEIRAWCRENKKPHQRCWCPVGKSVGYFGICLKHCCLKRLATLNSQKMPNHRLGHQTFHLMEKILEDTQPQKRHNQKSIHPAKSQL